MRNLLAGCESAWPSEAWVLRRCICVCMGTSCKQNTFIYSTKPIKLLRTIKNMLKIQLFKNSNLNTHSWLFSFSTFLFETSIIPLWFFPLVLLTLSGMCLVLHPTMPHWQWSSSAATITSKSTLYILYCLLNYSKRAMTLWFAIYLRVEQLHSIIYLLNHLFEKRWDLQQRHKDCFVNNFLTDTSECVYVDKITKKLCDAFFFFKLLAANFHYALVNLKFFFQEIFTQISFYEALMWVRLHLV